MVQQDTRYEVIGVKPGSSSDEMLQCKLRYEKYEDAHFLLLQVKDVYLGGPAHVAGLIPFLDFIMGTKEISCFKDLTMFQKYLQVNKD